MFQTAAAELESGTVTTPDTAGVTLTDSTALFVTNGVSRGDVVENVTDGSHSTVLSVTSETELVTLALKGGTDNQYGSGDTYHVIDFVSCSVTGGDLFAVDSAGSPIAPILYTFGTGPLTIEQDTSPAAAPVQPATILEGTLTWEEAQRIILAATAGKLSGAATTNVKIRDTADSKDRIDATVDADGNRTAVTLDGS